jgi:CheY-like chemotaxis protein
MFINPPIYILIVDDNELCLKVLERQIKRCGVANLHVTKAASAEEALELLKKKRYDIIFTDIEMSGMTGDEMTRKIRKEDRDIPIYAITCKDDSKSLLRFNAAGITKCLKKPVDVVTIYTIVNYRIEQMK